MTFLTLNLLWAALHVVVQKVRDKLNFEKRNYPKIQHDDISKLYTARLCLPIWGLIYKTAHRICVSGVWTKHWT